jgi:hypothetical protein
MPRRSSLALACALASIAAHAQTAVSGGPAQTAHSAIVSANGSQAVSPSTQGLLIAIDPVTRQWRLPTADELRELGALRTKAAVAPPVPQAMPGGPGTMIKLDPSFDSYMVAGKNPDGTLAMDCLPNAAAAADALAHGVRNEFAPRGSHAKEPLDVR